MEISSVQSLLSMQQDLAVSSTQSTGEDFKEALAQAVDNQDDTQLKQACDEMETYMLSMVFKEMKKCMLTEDDEDALIPKGDYTETFESTMIDTMAEKMVEAGGIGLSDIIYQQMKSTYSMQMQMASGSEAMAATSSALVDEEV